MSKKDLQLLMDIIDGEIALHQNNEGNVKFAWDRGYENGAFSEAIVIKHCIRKLMVEKQIQQVG